MPSANLSHHHTAHTGKFPENALKAGRKLELRNMFIFDAFELMEELPAGQHASDKVLVDEWRGGAPGRLVCWNARHVLHQLFLGQRCELQRLRNLCH